MYGDKSYIKRTNILTISGSKAPTAKVQQTVGDPYVAYDLTGQTNGQTNHNCIDTKVGDMYDDTIGTPNSPPHYQYSGYNVNPGTTKRNKFILTS